MVTAMRMSPMETVAGCQRITIPTVAAQNTAAGAEGGIRSFGA